MIPYSPLESYNLGLFTIDVELAAMIAAILAFVILVLIALKKDKQDMNRKNTILFFAITLISSFAFGRIWYFIANKDIIGIFNPTKIGLTSIGMIIGGAVGLAIYALVCLKKEMPRLITFARLADIIAAPTAFAVFIYRLFGCTVYGDIKGAPSDLPWCFLWPDGICRHPASLYLALSALLIFILLKIFFSKEKTENSRFGKRFDGESILWFLLLYFFNRFWIEFLIIERTIPVTKHLGLGVVQWVCLCVFMFMLNGLFANYYIIRKYNINNVDDYKHFIKKTGLIKMHIMAYKNITANITGHLDKTKI